LTCFDEIPYFSPMFNSIPSFCSVSVRSRVFVLMVLLLALINGCKSIDLQRSEMVFSATLDQPVRESLQQAIDEAIAAGAGMTLRIKPGVYHLHIPRGESGFALKVAGANDLTIEAGGVEFIITNSTIGFMHIMDSSNVVC
jgi:hypothetical protein